MTRPRAWRLIAALGVVFLAVPELWAASEDVPPLVGAGVFASLTERSGAVVLDVRRRGEFSAGHIPGAINLPMGGGAWLARRYSVPDMLPRPALLAARLGQAGIGSDVPVLLVAGSGSAAEISAGARAFWSLRALGHADLALLDGGYAAWRDAGHPVETGPPDRRAPVGYTAVPDRSVIAEVLHVEDALGDSIPPVDARDRPAFDGHVVAPVVARSGTILDAVNLPAEDLLAKDGVPVFLSPAALEEKVRATGAVTLYHREVVFSDTGLRAALVWFAMHELLGISSARLYDGSMAEWAREDYDIYDSTDGMGGVIGG